MNLHLQKTIWIQIALCLVLKEDVTIACSKRACDNQEAQQCCWGCAGATIIHSFNVEPVY